MELLYHNSTVAPGMLYSGKLYSSFTTSVDSTQQHADAVDGVQAVTATVSPQLAVGWTPPSNSCVGTR